MGYGLSNVVAKCHFLFYWNDSNVCAVVEVRSPFMKFALWLISRSRQVSFSLSLCSCGGTEQTLHKFAWTMLISHKFDPEMMSSKSAYDFSQGSLFLYTAVLRLHRNCKPACVKLIETLEFWTAEGSEQSASLPSLPGPLELHLANTFLPVGNFLSCSGFAFVRLHWMLLVAGQPLV